MSNVGLHSFEIYKNKQVAEHLMQLTIFSPTLAAQILPGQFMNLEVPGNSAELLRIPLSFSAADAEKGTIELVYAVVGSGTQRLSQLKVGTRASLVGPSGKPWRLPYDRGTAASSLTGVVNEATPVFESADLSDNSKKALLVAGGVGAPPIVALAGMLQARGIAFDVVLGAQHSSKLWGQVELEALGVSRLVITTDDGSAGIKGFVSAGVDYCARAERQAQTTVQSKTQMPIYSCVYICGPAPMIRAVAAQTKYLAHNCQVSLERMMCCGFGVCNTCNVALVGGGYASCCVDGPIFNADEVVL